MSQKNNKQQNIQEQLAELNQILQWFEQNDFDVEEALVNYETGMKLIESIETRLKDVENKVEVLKKRFDGE
jgi:exodeoxyribonuclease VII small subunit